MQADLWPFGCAETGRIENINSSGTVGNSGSCPVRLSSFIGVPAVPNIFIHFVRREAVLKILFYILHWLAYSVILSVMPIGINFLLAGLYGYPFNQIDAIEDLYITIFCLSATIIRDIIGSDHNHFFEINQTAFEIVIFFERFIIFLMLFSCCASAAVFGILMRDAGMDCPPEETTIRNLWLFIKVLWTGTIFFGSVTQVLTSDSE